MKTIEIIVSSNGQLTIETQGYAGRQCLEASRRLEAALGVKTSDRLTSEFYGQQSQADQRLEEHS